MTQKTAITVAHGDGIGPEIMEATLRILDEAGAALDIETIEIGEQVYKRGEASGLDDAAWESIYRTNCILKAPITTPQGGGYKSLNVTIRKTLGLFANIRPCAAYAPFVDTLQPKMDLVIVRENEEDLYAGIEYTQTANTAQSLKLISRTGSEKIIRYAFEYARVSGRKKVTCISKDNIMKQTDGLFHAVFDEVSRDYPRIEAAHMIADIGAARIAARPDQFDVVVTENLYGDIISDIAAEIAGSVGLCGSGNIGTEAAMFEAIHGSAPDIAGQGIANPSGLLHGAIMMLQHIGQNEVAGKIHNAWLKTIEDGIHTGEIYTEEHSTRKVNTKEFTDAVVERLGALPETFSPVTYADAEDGSNRPNIRTPALPDADPARKLVGVDVFLNWRDSRKVDALAEKLEPLNSNALSLSMIATQGLKLWPGGMRTEVTADHWQCRYLAANDTDGIEHAQVATLLQRLAENGFDFIKTENLYASGDARLFSAAQGE